jgi:hypothetical protein
MSRRGFSITPVDPEKGTLDPLPFQLLCSDDPRNPPDIADSPPGCPASKQEEEAAVTTTMSEVIVTEKSEPPAKLKVSKWVLWTVWFNTYKCFPSPHSPSRCQLVS